MPFILNEIGCVPRSFQEVGMIHPAPSRLFSTTGLLVLTLAGFSGMQAETEGLAEDERILKSAQIGITPAELLAYLQNRTIGDNDREAIERLIQMLGDDEFEKREQASRALIQRGRPVLPYLRKAAQHTDLEIARRAATCVEQLEQGSSTIYCSAVLRLIAHHRPRGATEILLRYAPHAEEEQVEEEWLATILALNKPRIDPSVLTALTGKNSIARAGAAFVVGQSPTEEIRNRIVDRLKDADAGVRFRSAQGLLLARDRRAVPVLIDLLGTDNGRWTWEAEDLLLRLAGGEGPQISAGKGTAEDRLRWRDTWADWWQKQKETIDLARMDEREPYLGLTLVPEMHGGAVWECGPDGKERWRVSKLNMPRDAQVLPRGRLLVAEVNTNRVIECDIATGKVHWTYQLTDPAYVRRLPNGNTFMGNHHHAVEVTPGGMEVFKYTPEQGFFIHSMNRRPNGNLVCLSMNGMVREVDRQGKEVVGFKLDTQGNWCGVEGLPGQRYLVVEYNNSLVKEVDARGKVLWECKVAGASYARRLPNGRTMICCFGGQRIVHVNREGTVVWEKKVGSSPWRAHFR